MKVDIDGFKLIEASKDAPWQREEIKKPEEFEPKYDPRKSLAWDSAFFTSPGVLDAEELFDALNIHDGDNGVKEASGLPSNSLVATRFGECIARRSLAWDAAFFTSEGVLNPEELTMVNNGYKNSEPLTHILPGIEEELWKSTESNSTTHSDCSLSSLEIDLFDDMRASNLVNSCCILHSQTCMPNPHFSDRLEATLMRIKPSPVSRRPKTSRHVVVKTTKEGVNPPQKQLSKTISQAANPLSSAATTRASLGANNMKVNDKIRKAISGQNMSKKPCVGDCGTPSPASREHSRSVCGQITSIDKSPNSLRRKNDSSASDSNARTPSRSLTRRKSKRIDSSQPTDLQSTPISSSTSLFNSIDSWSSEPSASVNHVSNNFRKSLDTAFNSGVPKNNDASQVSVTENFSSDEPSGPSGSKETRLPCQDVDRLSKGSCPLPQTDTVSKQTIPSGLRLPSPKIGFF
ncbi:hypothetical protein PTKIN_Ptkin13bG0191900 [Pterospermum kingtungense]